MRTEMYQGLIRPFLDKRDSETWHDRARKLLQFAEINPFTLKLLEKFASHGERFRDPRLKVVLGGIELDNPVMVGAGWDKAGHAVKALYTLGFSGVEVGSVLAYPQPGNPKPRQFMIGPGVAINSLGFNSPGMEKVAQNLEKYRGSGIPIGLSLGKNKDIDMKFAPEAYAAVVEKLYHDAAYFAVNVSSPNTPGLRQLQDKQPLTDILQAIHGMMGAMGGRKPTFVKISPDLTNEALDDVIRVVSDHGLAGIIATNTTTRDDLKASYGEQWRSQAGGLSGSDRTYRQMATEKIAHIFKQTAGKMDIIGVGGVNSAEAALEKIFAGARVVQVVTAIREVGPTVPGIINWGIADYMDREGISDLEEVRGKGV